MTKEWRKTWHKNRGRCLVDLSPLLMLNDTQVAREREREAALLIVPVWESMADWTRLENTLNLSISEYSNSALIVTQVQNLMEILKEFQNIKKSENPIYDRKYFRKGSHWVYLLYKQNSLCCLERFWSKFPVFKLCYLKLNIEIWLFQILCSFRFSTKI